MIDYSAHRWLNPPADWSVDGSGLRVTTGDRGDFWQGTFYGFHPDSGHFFHRRVTGDFTAEVSFEGQYETLYDQAGLMLRVDAQHWIKLGVEFTDGATNFSVVSTMGQSDWSVVRVERATGPLSVRITRVGMAAIADYLTPAGTWQMLRLCPFPAAEELMVGPMACSPQRAGFQVRFTSFAIGPARENPLHG